MQCSSCCTCGKIYSRCRNTCCMVQEIQEAGDEDAAVQARHGRQAQCLPRGRGTTEKLPLCTRCCIILGLTRSSQCCTCKASKEAHIWHFSKRRIETERCCWRACCSWDWVAVNLQAVACDDHKVQTACFDEPSIPMPQWHWSWQANKSKSTSLGCSCHRQLQRAGKEGGRGRGACGRPRRAGWQQQQSCQEGARQRRQEGQGGRSGA